MFKLLNDTVSNQIEAIQTMIENQKNKLTNLAKDIIKHGLNPADLVVVKPYENRSKQYIVLEGNRRIVALKLLNNPQLIPDKYKGLYNNFIKLSERFDANPIVEIPCIVFQDEKEANRWIRLKHTGENAGVGTVTWNAQQIARFEDKLEGNAPYALQMIEFLSKQDGYDEEFKKSLKKVHSSSLKRLLDDPDVREVIGISVEQRRLVSDLPPNELMKPMTKIIKDLLHPNFKVKDIYYKDDRLNYIETFKRSELPNKNKALKVKWDLQTDNPPKVDQKNSDPDKHQKKSLHLSRKRDSIIPKSCILQINQPRINQIYRELKDISLKYFCNAAAITFRVFVELSVDHYIEEKSINNVNKDNTLRKKIEVVANFMETSNRLDKHQLKGIRVAVSNPNNIMSVDTFNSYVHNKSFNPIPEDLKLSWNNIELFIKKMWE